MSTWHAIAAAVLLLLFPLSAIADLQSACQRRERQYTRTATSITTMNSGGAFVRMNGDDVSYSIQDSPTEFGDCFEVVAGVDFAFRWKCANTFMHYEIIQHSSYSVANPALNVRASLGEGAIAAFSGFTSPLIWGVSWKSGFHLGALVQVVLEGKTTFTTDNYYGMWISTDIGIANAGTFQLGNTLRFTVDCPRGAYP